MTNVIKKPNLVLITIIYLAGIFMGAIDTGIVTPARTIIQSNLGVDGQTGIWMITIYTLAYAASIPIMGKFADKFGRKYVYLLSVTLFGTGSLLCGLSQEVGSFSMLLIARAIQAIGGGGIVPVATAEFGTSYPPEKRGMALGMVGGVYGIANIFGASAGSGILDLFGQNNWQFILYVNIPITLFIILAGIFVLPRSERRDTKKVDGLGILTLTVMVLSLLYGLKNIDFFEFLNSMKSTDVYPYLLIFILLLPVFVLIEKKAADPVMNLKYFTNKNIVVTLIISFISGVVMMGMIFVPQFSENVLKIKTGSGGYLVIILGLFAGVAAPVSGKLIDKFGAKLILALGFIISIVGSVFLVFVTTYYPNMLTVVIGLVFTGLGIGFTMGTPINYMMMANTDEAESNSALATVSLVRSIGTAIAPTIMVGFIAAAGGNIQSNVMNLLPQELTVPDLPYEKEITDTFNTLKENPQMAEKLKDITIPDLTAMQTVKIDFNGSSDFEMPEDLENLMKDSDVTTIVENSKTLSSRMFDMMTPNVIASIEAGIDQGIAGINAGIPELEKQKEKLNEGYTGLSQGIMGMEAGIKEQKAVLTQLQSILEMMSKQGANNTLPSGMSLADLLPVAVKKQMPVAVLEELEEVKSLEQLKAKEEGLTKAIANLETELEKSKKGQEGMKAGLRGIETAEEQMNDMVTKMNSLKAAIPDSFAKAKDNYLKAIDDKKVVLEESFQITLNVGFQRVYLTSAIAAALAIVFLAFYSNKRTDYKTEVLEKENASVQ